jgi:hypothetical protein
VHGSGGADRIRFHLTGPDLQGEEITLNDHPARGTTGNEKPPGNGSGGGSESSSSGRGTPARGRNSTSFTTESAREAAQASARARREKKAQRAQRAQDNALTFRQRLGVSLSKLSQAELDQVVSGLAHRGNANALARLADQAFGKPLPAEEDVPREEGLASLSREELAVLRQVLEEGSNLDESQPQPAEGHSPSA